MLTGAVALAGSAALGTAARALVRRMRRSRIFGVPVPDPKKLAGGVDLKQVAKLIGNVAEQLEARSDDVRILSGQAKRLSRKLS